MVLIEHATAFGSMVDLDSDGRDDVMIGGWGTQARLLLTDIEAYQAAQPPFEELTPEGE